MSPTGSGLRRDDATRHRESTPVGSGPAPRRAAMMAHLYSRSQGWVRGAVVPGLLTRRGLLTGERESFRAVIWAAVVTVGVPTGPQALSREPEKSGAPPETRETLCQRPITRKPRAHWLSGLSANWRDAESPLILAGSSDVTLFVTIASSRMGGPRALAEVLDAG
jgi:hypothetical protein